MSFAAVPVEPACVMKAASGPSPPAFVINLAFDTARRAHMQAQLAAAGIEAEFTPAVDGRSLSQADRAGYDRARALRVYGVDMTPNEIGCYLSHYRLYQRMVEQGIEAALILEDDVAVDPGLRGIVAALMAQPDWLVVRLESLRGRVREPRNARERGTLMADLGVGGLYRLNTHPLGLGGYLIRLEGARRMLAYGARMFMPIDQTMDRFWENGVEPYVVRPFPVRQLQQAFGSSIGERDPGRYRASGLRVRIGRRLQRIADSARKRLHLLTRG
jgi:glycosyl transferase family 25